MSYTIVRKIEAGAFRATDGAVYYALLTEVASSNMGPRSFERSISAFGTAREILEHALQGAGDFAGGMAQGVSGRVLPETYVGRVVKALSNPSPLVDPGGYTVRIDPFEQEGLGEALQRLGIEDAADFLLRGRCIEFTLSRRPDIVAALRGALPRGERESIKWRIAFDRKANPEEGLEFDRADLQGGDEEAPCVPHVYFVDVAPESTREILGTPLLLESPSGEMKYVTADYRAEGSFLEDYGLGFIRRSGGVSAPMKEFRQRMRERIPAPSDTVVRFDPSVLRDDAALEGKTREILGPMPTSDGGWCYFNLRDLAHLLNRCGLSWPEEELGCIVQLSDGAIARRAFFPPGIEVLRADAEGNLIRSASGCDRVPDGAPRRSHQQMPLF